MSPRVTNVVGAAPAELRPGPASLRVKVLWSCARMLVVVVVVLVWRGVYACVRVCAWRGKDRRNTCSSLSLLSSSGMQCACANGTARVGILACAMPGIRADLCLDV